MAMVNRKFVKKFLAVASAAALAVSVVAGDYCTAYAATAAPAIDVEGGLSYLLQMLSSGLGVQVSKASVPALWLAVDAQAKANDPEYMAELRSYCEDNSLISTRELDPSFCNQLLKDLRSIFGSSEREEGSMDFVLPFAGVSQSSDLTSLLNVDSFFGIPQLSLDGRVSDLMSQYEYTIVRERSDLKGGYFMYCFDNVPMPLQMRLSSGRYNLSVPCDTYTYALFDNEGSYCNIYTSSNNASITLSNQYSLYFSSDISLSYGGFIYSAKGSVLSADHVWVDAYDDAALHVPVITAPVSVPADVADMDENLKSVSLAEDKDALYKALAAAGIAIDIGIDVPDETDKPTDAEIPDDGSVSVGKSLSDILAAITGLADKVAAIPSDIAAFFTPDMTAVSESFDSLKDSLMLKFGGLLQLADVFNRSYKFDTVIPVIKIPIPDNETLRTIFDQKTELVILDLTPFASDFQNFRSLLTAMLYVAFAFWFLDEFDVKIHIG